MKYLISVTQLYGEKTVEHRNMPVEDAVKYIFKDFKKHTNPESVKPDPSFPTANQFNTIVQTPELEKAHPDPVQTLLQALVDNRPLTVLQYERVIKYLNERKDMQRRAEIGEDPVEMEKEKAKQEAAKAPPPVVDPEIAKQAELQKKIMEILNKPSLTESMKKIEEPKVVIPPSVFASLGKSNTTSRTTSTSSEPKSKLLQDEKVKNALNFLLLKKP